MRYIIGVGTNIGDRKENIKKAVDSFDLIPKCSVIRQSKIYETEPVGYAEQDNFYNAVFEIESELNANEILGACLGIEAALGRVREIKNGPRIIDLDLILAENEEQKSENLILPHPRFKERRFVLIPLLELFPDGVAYGTEFKSSLFGIKGQGIKEI